MAIITVAENKSRENYEQKKKKDATPLHVTDTSARRENENVCAS